MTRGVPGFFRHENSVEGVWQFCVLFQGNAQDLPVALFLGLGGLELIRVVALGGEETQGAELRGVGDGNLQKTVLLSGLHGERGVPERHFPADLVKKSLQVNVVLGGRRHREVEAGFSRQTDFLADEPFDIHRNRQFPGQNQIRGRGNFRQQDGLRLIAVTDQRGCEDFFWKRKMQGAGGVALGQSPFDGGCHAGIARIFPVDVPARLRLEP